MTQCKSVCKQLSSTRDGSRGARYGEGVSFCKYCNIFMLHDGRYCPCCSTLVRHGPRYMGKKVHAM